MKARPYWKFSVSTTTEAEDAVSMLLSEIFKVPTVTHHNTLSGKTAVSVFLSHRKDLSPIRRRSLREGLRRLRDHGIPTGTGRVRVRLIPAEDWSTSWKRHFKPWEPGPSLLVKPSWSHRKAKSGQAVLTLDPGLSFGTGQHATTRFCLQTLVRIRARGTVQSMLDIGTGSGILAIAGALLGFKCVEAFDFDPDAVRVARENAHLNHMHRRMRLFQADLTRLPRNSKQTFDVVCANLMFDLLIAERRRILSRVSPKGYLILAGILKSQFPQVQGAFEEEGWTLRRAKTEKEWRSGLFQKASFDQSG